MSMPAMTQMWLWRTWGSVAPLFAFSAPASGDGSSKNLVGICFQQQKSTVGVNQWRPLGVSQL